MNIAANDNNFENQLDGHELFDESYVESTNPESMDPDETVSNMIPVYDDQFDSEIDIRAGLQSTTTLNTSNQTGTYFRKMVLPANMKILTLPRKLPTSATTFPIVATSQSTSTIHSTCPKRSMQSPLSSEPVKSVLPPATPSIQTGSRKKRRLNESPSQDIDSSISAVQTCLKTWQENLPLHQKENCPEATFGNFISSELSQFKNNLNKDMVKREICYLIFKYKNKNNVTDSEE